MIRVPDEIRREVINTYGRFFERVARIPAEKCAADVLNEEKVDDQIALLCETIGVKPHRYLRDKKLLEIGSGFGVFLAVTKLDYGLESYGIEPAGEGFESSFILGRKILQAYGLDPNIMVDAVGEQIPFPEKTFDILFSSTVLEHTQDPERVLREAIRVLKPGGYLQFVFPNYGSVFEGHYAIPWIPYMNHWLAHLWIRLWGRDPSFIGTIQFLNYFKIREWVSSMNDIRVITYGEEIFRTRMLNLDIKDWAGLGRVRGWLELANKFHVVPVLTSSLLLIKSFEPIVLTLQKLKVS